MYIQYIKTLLVRKMNWEDVYVVGRVASPECIPLSLFIGAGTVLVLGGCIHDEGYLNGAAGQPPV